MVAQSTTSRSRPVIVVRWLSKPTNLDQEQNGNQAMWGWASRVIGATAWENTPGCPMLSLNTCDHHHWAMTFTNNMLPCLLTSVWSAGKLRAVKTWIALELLGADFSSEQMEPFKTEKETKYTMERSCDKCTFLLFQPIFTVDSTMKKTEVRGWGGITRCVLCDTCAIESLCINTKEEKSNTWALCQCDRRQLVASWISQL